MKVGIIDLGTNTFNILIVDINNDGSLEYLLNTKSPVMLGSEGINQGFISDKAFTRAYGVLRDFSQTLNDFKCEKIVAFGTSAIRSASNSSSFIDKIKADFGISIEKITGDQEAHLIYEGVRRAVDFIDENYLILDIGGGSNELIIANKNGVLWQESFLLGGARLYDKIQPSDPIKQSEIDRLYNYLEEQLPSFVEAVNTFPVTQLVGSSGAFDSYAEILYQKKHGVPLPKTQVSNIITLEEFDQVFEDVVPAHRADRMLIPGLEHIRVDTIVLSALFTKYVIEKSKVKGIIQSAYALKEGVAASYI